MSHILMHNRFAEGFLESHSWGYSLDAMAGKIRPLPFAESEAEEIHRRAHAARNAALAAATVEAWRELRTIFRVLDPIGPLLRWFRAWRARDRAANELYALDDRTLAELGLRRSDIPFVAAGGAPVLDRSPAETPAPRHAANGNTKHAA